MPDLEDLEGDADDVGVMCHQRVPDVHDDLCGGSVERRASDKQPVLRVLQVGV